MQTIHYIDFSLHFISASIFSDVEKIRDAISEKVSQFVCLALQSLSCVVLSFAYGWELSLVVISYLPIVMISNTFIGKVCLHSLYFRVCFKFFFYLSHL